MKVRKKFCEIKLIPGKLLHQEELINIRGGISQYCATQFAIISCNDDQPNNFFQQNCSQAPSGAAYWGAAQGYDIPMAQSSCDGSWYGN